MKEIETVSFSCFFYLWRVEKWLIFT